MRHTIVVLLFSATLFAPFQWAVGVGMELRGNKPLADANYTDWPGVVHVINNPSRVYQRWVNGGETNYFQGDTNSLNDALVKFAEVEVPVHEVFLVPGPVSASAFDDETFTYDWRLELLGGISHFRHERETETQVYIDHPTLVIFIGGGNIVLEELAIPEGITLLKLEDLRARYYQGLKSSERHVQHAAVGRLAAFDPYNDETFERITGTHIEAFAPIETWDTLSRPEPPYIDPALVATRLQRFGKSARPTLVKQLDREDLGEDRLKWVRKAIQAIDAMPDAAGAKSAFQARDADIATFVAHHRTVAGAPSE